MQKWLATFILVAALSVPTVILAQTTATIFLPAVGNATAFESAPEIETPGSDDPEPTEPENPVPPDDDAPDAPDEPSPAPPDDETPPPPDEKDPPPDDETPPPSEPTDRLVVSGVLRAHFMDVGQGDATLLVGPDFTFLIDAGRHDRNDVVPYLQHAGVAALDLLVGTHPHADHIGQMDKVLDAYAVDEVWMSGDEHTSLTFERVLDAIHASDAAYHEPRAGETYDMGAAVVHVLNPATLTGDFHEGSIIMRVVFDGIALLFTGDAEAQTEAKVIHEGHDLRADILQVGHHGSTTSSTQPFLEAVNPALAIWSAGANNQYGHPHAPVIQRFADLDIDTHGTADCGTLIVTVVALSIWMDSTKNDCRYERLASHVQLGQVGVATELRADAHADTPLVEAVGAGTTLWALGTNGAQDWKFVRTASGAVGWLPAAAATGIDADSLPLIVAPSPTPQEPEPGDPVEPEPGDPEPTEPGDPTPQEPEPTDPDPTEPQPEPTDPPPACVNINMAAHEELQQIVHIGPERATQLIELREVSPFASVDDMTRISGIGPSRLADIKEQGLACV